jgi:hypothetical protein
MTTKPQQSQTLRFLSPTDRALLISAQRKLETERVRRGLPRDGRGTMNPGHFNTVVGSAR